MFSHIEYREWMAGRPEVAMYDLGSTDLRAAVPERPTAVPGALDGRDDPPVGATLEMQIAAEYGVDPEQVLVTAGASHAAFLATAVALGADPDGDGDTDARALVETPGHEPHHRIPRAFGASVDRCRRAPEEAYRLDPTRIADALTDDTRLITVSNRHNPSGRLTGPDALDAVADAARERDATLLVDETHAPFVPEADATTGALGGPTVAGAEGTVAVGSLGKFLGLGDLRIGWLIADAATVERARAVAAYVPGVADVSRAYAIRAFHHLDDLAADQRAHLSENADLLAAFADDRDDVTGPVADGSPYAFLEFDDIEADQLVERAWESGLLVVPGRFFGDPERVRVSLGRAPADAAAALRALDALA